MRARVIAVAAAALIGAIGSLAPIRSASAEDERSADTRDATAALRTGEQSLDAGRFDDANDELTRAADLFRRAREPENELVALLALSQAQLATGSVAEADATLRTLMPLAETVGTSAQRAAALAAAGTLALARDDLDEAGRLLRDAATRASGSGDARLSAAIELNRGTLEALVGDPSRAARALESAAARADEAGDRGLALRARANAARALVRAAELDRALATAERAQRDAEAAPASYAKAALLIHLAVTHREIAERAPSLRPAARRHARAVLASALDAARASRDPRGEADALGYLGALYEEGGRHEEALRLTSEALLVGAASAAPESTYRWQWQSARLLAAVGREDEAVAAYERAVRTLGEITPGALASRRNDVPFDRAVEPVYRGLVDMLLRRAARSAGADSAAALRSRARDVLEQSKAAELRDYFRDDCVDAMRARVRPLGDVSTSAAIVYPIVLDERLEILVQPARGVLAQFTVEVSREELGRELERFRQLLLRRTTREYRGPARRLHDWLVAPWRDTLSGDIDTIVFVPDGLLRTVPMAALYDGERFLVERWAVAVTPGIELTDPQPLSPAERAVLLGGLSRPVDGLPALAHVRDEIAALHEAVGGDVLLDDAFRREAVGVALAEDRFGVVHLATHAEFGADASESYLVTSDGRLTGSELASTIGKLRFRAEPLELLTLSACETARGDERAALGLLGIAVQAGARSAVGSLWKVNDDSTALLMRAFYLGMARDGLSRAEALRRAQLGLLAAPEWNHPLYWSGFVLISSWL